MKTTLNNLKVGQKAQITKINLCNPLLKRRLMEMGITAGTIIEVIKFAPLGDPVAIKVRNYTLSIRKRDLSLIEGVILNKEDNPTYEK